MAVMAFDKRDNMGYAIHPILIMLIVMVAAAGLVAVGAGISRVMGNSEDTWKNRSAAQDDYMREVRARNHDALMRQGYTNVYKPRSSDLASSSRMTSHG